MFLVPLLRENRHSLLLLIWMTIMPLACSAVVTVIAIKYEVYIREFTFSEWVLFYTCTVATMALALTPTTFIAVISGFFLGWLSIPLMLVSYLGASAAGFFLARYIDQGKFRTSINQLPNVSRIVESIDTKQLSFIILCRISPILPFSIMNVVLSMIKVNFPVFIWAGFLGMLPRTLIFIWIGSTLQQLKEIMETGETDLTQISFLLLLVISIAGFYMYFKNLISKKLSNNDR
jgi:uncharacterized membrane protein YdjX (TVP38/TMEM64 family)